MEEGAGGWGQAPGVVPGGAELSATLGGLSASCQGEAGGRAPEARLWSIPQGCSPPAKAAHRPDSTARVPGRIDVRGWKGREQCVNARALVFATAEAGPSARAQLSAAQLPGHAGTRPRWRGAQRAWPGRFWGCGGFGRW